MISPSDQAEFEQLAAAIDAANAHPSFIPERVRQPTTELFDLVLDAVNPPAQLSKDWRDDDVVTPVKQQKNCHSCASFAAASAIEAMLRIRSAADTTIIDAGFLNTCVVQGGQDACDAGADLGPALKWITQAGYAAVTGPTLYPYPTNQCAGVALKPLGGFSPLGGPNAVKNALLTAPIVAEIYPDQGFTHFQGASVYRSATPMNGWYPHSLCIIGFNSDGWIVKNSFGPVWGNGGFAVIAYQTCGLFGLPIAGNSGRAFSMALA